GEVCSRIKCRLNMRSGGVFITKTLHGGLVLCLSKFLCRAYLKISDGIGLCCLKSVFRFSL
ncbi:TPA: hypothetical protein ACFOMI_002044, partial [Neisseria meningitidis]